MFQLFAKRGYATRYSSYIYVISWINFGVFFKTPYAIWICHTIFLIYICASVKLNEFDMPHDIPHIYICVFEAILCFICHTIFHIYIAKTSTHYTLIFHKGPSTEARGHIYIYISPFGVVMVILAPDGMVVVIDV